MKRKHFSIMVSLLLAFSLLLTGMAFADSGRGNGNAFGHAKNKNIKQPANNGRGHAYGHVKKGLDVELLDEKDTATKDKEVKLENKKDKDKVIEVDLTLPEIEKKHKATDITSKEKDKAAPEPKEGNLKKAVSQAGYLENAVSKSVYGKVSGINFEALIRQLEGTDEDNAARLGAVVKKLYQFTWKNQELLNKDTKAAESLVLLTDELVRLTYHSEINVQVKSNIYLDAARIYTQLDCNLRAKGVRELAAAAAPNKVKDKERSKYMNNNKHQNKHQKSICVSICSNSKTD